MNVTEEDLAQELNPLLDSLLNSSSQVQHTQRAARTVLPNVCVLMCTSHLSLLHPDRLLRPRCELLRCQVHPRCLHSPDTRDHLGAVPIHPAILFPAHIPHYEPQPRAQASRCRVGTPMWTPPHASRSRVRVTGVRDPPFDVSPQPHLPGSRPACTDSTYLVAPSTHGRFLRSRTHHSGDPSSAQLALLTRSSRWWQVPLTLTHTIRKECPDAPAFNNLTHSDMDMSRCHGYFGSRASLPTDSDIPLLADTLSHLENCVATTPAKLHSDLYTHLPGASA